ncbi:MAG: rod shape-determining protein RodA [Crocinitomicaceae bacterium]|nr:rod shape-determining protein RodA [Crocinitomicaceae bacterium]|tara:strand:+ start:18216 stop:19547 length:1332 start_codon:yes stop_codon:yes gene_type:complete
MKNRNLSIWKNIDKPLILLYFVLSVMGYLIMYSSSFKGGELPHFFFNTIYGKQLIWIILTILMGLFALIIDGNFIKNSSYYLYGFVLILLIVVLFMPPIKGARSWFYFSGFSFQPSEFIKLGLSLAIAKLLSDVGSKFKDFKTKLKAFLLIMIPSILIAFQPDPGTMLVFSCFIFVLYREGLSGNFLLIALFTILIAIVGIFLKASNSIFYIGQFPLSGNLFFGFLLIIGFVFSFLIIRYFVLPRYRKQKIRSLIFISILGLSISGGINVVYDSIFKERHRTRFQIMFGIKEDRKGAGYNIYQALSAIGSGESFGKGFLKGTLSNDKYKHVPEQNTDFIFCVLAEEWGFIGSLFFIILYLATLIRIITISERQRSKFTRIYGYCISSILFFHFMINIAMVIGLAPVIGIPLPFFSKGGSAILSFGLMIFLLLRLDAERKVVLR